MKLQMATMTLCRVMIIHDIYDELFKKMCNKFQHVVAGNDSIFLLKIYLF